MGMLSSSCCPDAEHQHPDTLQSCTNPQHTSGDPFGVHWLMPTILFTHGSLTTLCIDTALLTALPAELLPCSAGHFGGRCRAASSAKPAGSLPSCHSLSPPSACHARSAMRSLSATTCVLKPPELDPAGALPMLAAAGGPFLAPGPSSGRSFLSAGCTEGKSSPCLLSCCEALDSVDAGPSASWTAGIKPCCTASTAGGPPGDDCAGLGPMPRPELPRPAAC